MGNGRRCRRWTGIGCIPSARLCAARLCRGAFISRTESSARVAEEIRLANGKALVVQTDVTRAETVQKAVTAALRARVGFAPLAISKASLRMLGQSLAREFHPKGIHAVHVLVDGQINTPKLRGRDPNRAAETIVSPDSIAAIVLFTLKQTPMLGRTNSTCGLTWSRSEICAGTFDS